MINYRELVRNLGPWLAQHCRLPWLRLLAKEYFGTVRIAGVDALTSLYLRIRNRDGCLSKFRPNPAQKQYAQARGPRNIILKARQVGMTTYIAARFFLLTLLREGAVTLQVAHTHESAQQIFRIVRRFFEVFRPSVRDVVVTDRETIRELAFSEIDSRYLVDTAGNPRVGRGLTIHNLHASEVALWPGDPRETMASLLAAVTPDGQVDVESSPHGVGGYFHSEWLRAVRGEPGAMTPHFFPWWIEQAYQRELPHVGAGLPRHLPAPPHVAAGLLRHPAAPPHVAAGLPRHPAVPPPETVDPYSEEERCLARLHGLTAEQIQFRRWIRATFGELARQEYAENAATCFLVSGRPVFEIALIERRLADTPAPVATEHNNALLVWYPPQPGRSYVIGADVAEGRERGDYSAASVIDAASGLQCAELLERWPIWRFAQELDALGRRYHTALIAVERNNHGHAVLHALRHQLHYPRLYRHRGLFGTIDSAAADGWPMNAQTKPEAIQILARMLRDAPEAFNSIRLLEQCRSFSWTEDGRMGARGGTGDDPGGHDDLVIAMAIALAVRAQAPPLELLTAAS